MTAYPTTDLYNKYIQEQASEAFMQKCIDETVYSNILEKSAHTLYTPNYFIRIGLALLTAVAITLSMVLVWLMTSASSDEGIIALLIFFALICYGLLEFMVKLKKYYNAGIDNILQAATVLFIISAFLVNDFDSSYEAISCITLLVCLWLTIRFTDAFMAIVFFIALITFFFLLYIKLGTIGKLTAPFALMLLSIVLYFFIQKLAARHNLIIYKYCIQWIRLLTLITFYAAGNYHVVNKLSMEMFGAPAAPAALAPLFWTLTLTIPPLYIFYGIKKKDKLFYRTGMVLTILSVLTVRYYHTVMPAEIAMIIFGILTIAVSYVLIKYLSTRKKGFTFENTGHKEKMMVDAEALIIAQVFGRNHVPQNDAVQFGGGSSGGGGATGSY
ncbi:hypothetical protein BH10BAC2_BH10BAC2_29150 [soil metagenome]